MRTFKTIIILLLIAGSGAFAMQSRLSRGVMIFTSENEGPVMFGITRLQEALMKQGLLVTVKELHEYPIYKDAARIVINRRLPVIDGLIERAGGKPLVDMQPEGFCIRRTARENTIWVVGKDDAGTMYGTMRLAEIITLEKRINAIQDIDQNPAITIRGLKFNIPLDARTPSYDDTGDAAQSNIANMWELSFWHEFLDSMALSRYNTLTLWNPHPFPSMVKVNRYPDVALEDVMVCNRPPVDIPGAWGEPMGVNSEVLDNLKVIRKMTIQDKIDFWRQVMQYAADRGIRIYLITWNVVVNGAEGKYGITAEQTNDVTIDYIRQSVREIFRTYPLLAGIGVTAGENMTDREDDYDRESWLFKAYGMGVLDAVEASPGRDIRFIHRIWNTELDNITSQFTDRLPVTFDLSFKYARAHMYSTTKPPFAGELSEQLRRNNLNCWWNLRNDDIFVFRWGDPDYVRNFLANFPRDVTGGYHMGSDGYVWGVDFSDLHPQSPRRLEMDKHWYKFTLWGRLGYNPGLDREFFVLMLENRFPETDAEDLYECWKTASKIIPEVTRFHWSDWDFMWAPEGCFDHNKFHTVLDFISHDTMPGMGMLNISEYARRVANNEPYSDVMTPPEVIDNLRTWSGTSLSMARTLRRQTREPSDELTKTLSDIEAMAHLGSYYANKIQAALDLKMYEIMRQPEFKTAAVKAITQAASDWEIYAQVAASRYKPQLLARTQTLDWLLLVQEVRHDIQLVENFGGYEFEAVTVSSAER